MKPSNLITLILGIIFIVFGILILVTIKEISGLIPLFVGGALFYIGWHGGRTALIVLGHLLIVLGCFLITWGIYLLPYSKPILSHIFTRPLFWGLFSLMGGICANYHGFCQCIRK